MQAWAVTTAGEGAPTLVDQRRSGLLSRLRELGRIAATIDGAAAGIAPGEPRARLVRGWSPAVFDHAHWSSHAAVTTELLLGDLARHGITVLRRPDLEGPARARALDTFKRVLHPILTPLTLDPAHPLPRARLRGLFVVGTLAPVVPGARPRFTLVPLPPRGWRWIRVDGSRGVTFAPVEELVRTGLASMFPDELIAAHALRIVRPEEVEAEPRPAVTLEYEPGTPAPILEKLRTELRLEPEGSHATRGLLGLADLGALCDAVERL